MREHLHHVDDGRDGLRGLLDGDQVMAAWTTPRTWNSGELVTAALMNQHVRDQLAYLHGDGGGTVDLSAGGAVYKISTSGGLAVGTVVANATSGIGVGLFSSYLNAISAAGTDSGIVMGVSGETSWRVIVRKDGTILWGDGTVAAGDTQAARSAAGRLKVTNVEAETRAAVTYGTTVTIDARAQKWATITVTNATAFTIAAPTNPPGAGETQDLSIEVLNSSGGAMGAITWNAIFRGLSAGQPINWTNPANGQRSVAHFRWSGNSWVLINAVSAFT